MRHQDQNSTTTVVAAMTIGSALGHVAAKLNKWKKQRAEVTSELRTLLHYGQKMLADLGHPVPPTPDVATMHRGGRLKGHKTSAATKTKLRAAWKARKAAAAQAEAPKKRVISAEGKDRIAPAQKTRWAKSKKRGKGPTSGATRWETVSEFVSPALRSPADRRRQRDELRLSSGRSAMRHHIQGQPGRDRAA